MIVMMMKIEEETKEAQKKKIVDWRHSELWQKKIPWIEETRASTKEEEEEDVCLKIQKWTGNDENLKNSEKF